MSEEGKNSDTDEPDFGIQNSSGTISRSAHRKRPIAWGPPLPNTDRPPEPRDDPTPPQQLLQDLDGGCNVVVVADETPAVVIDLLSSPASETLAVDANRHVKRRRAFRDGTAADGVDNAVLPYEPSTTKSSMLSSSPTTPAGGDGGGTHVSVDLLEEAKHDSGSSESSNRDDGGRPTPGDNDRYLDSSEDESSAIPALGGEGQSEYFESGSSSNPEDGDNDSTCFECGCGGTLTCCDHCVRSYHTDCVPTEDRPRDGEEWSCPACRVKTSRGVMLRKRGYSADHSRPSATSLNNRPSAAVPRRSSNTTTTTTTRGSLHANTRRIAGEGNATTTVSRSSSSSTSSMSDTEQYHEESTYKTRIAAHDTNGSDFRNSSSAAIQRSEGGGDVTKRLGLTCRGAGGRGGLGRRGEIGISDGRVRRGPGPSVKRTSEGSTVTSKINIGPMYQVPGIPNNFLEAMELGVNYGVLESWRRLQRAASSMRTGHGANESRLVFSASSFRRTLAKKFFGEGKDRDDTDGDTTDGTVPRGTEEIDDESLQRRLNEFCDSELNKYLSACERNWPQSIPWPFAPEFATKLLHFNEYSIEKALRSLDDVDVHFQEACDPPIRPYNNKWRPNDRRNQLSSVPFPPNTINQRASGRVRHNPTVS